MKVARNGLLALSGNQRQVLAARPALKLACLRAAAHTSGIWRRVTVPGAPAS